MNDAFEEHNTGDDLQLICPRMIGKAEEGMTDPTLTLEEQIAFVERESSNGTEEFCG